MVEDWVRLQLRMCLQIGLLGQVFFAKIMMSLQYNVTQ